MRNLKKSLQVLSLMVVTAVVVAVPPSGVLAQTSEAAITQQSNLIVQRNFEVKPLEIYGRKASESVDG